MRNLHLQTGLGFVVVFWTSRFSVWPPVGTCHQAAPWILYGYPGQWSTVPSYRVTFPHSPLTVNK